MAYWNYFPKATSVAERKKEAEKLIAKLAKSGGCSPVVLSGRTISTSYWGTAWCKHIEGWQDHANRLERGRSYVRSGTVVDLRLEPGAIIGKVNGSSLYNVRIQVTALPALRWKAFKAACYGQVGSLLDLLQGRLPELVLRQLTSAEEGLFPRTMEMKLSCDCPDGAYMCKHVAAVLYGVGSRLDTQPELLFTLRGLDHTELVAHAATAAVDLAAQQPQEAALKDEDLAGIFGIELASAPEAAMPTAPTQKPAIKKVARELVQTKAKQAERPTKATPSRSPQKSGTAGKTVKTTQREALRGKVSKKAAPKQVAKGATPKRSADVKAKKKEAVKSATKKTSSRSAMQPKSVQGAVAKKSPAKKKATIGVPKQKAAPVKAGKTPKAASTPSAAPKKTAGRKVAQPLAKRGTTTKRGRK